MSREILKTVAVVPAGRGWRVLLGTVWLTTLCFAGCDGDVDSPQSKDAEKDGSGGLAPTGSGGGTGGTDPSGGGGTGGTDATGGGPEPGQLYRNTDGVLVLEMTNIEGAYQMSCSGTGSTLREENPPSNVVPWIDQGEGSYYLDGDFEPNPRRNPGCDVQHCSPYPERQYFAGGGVIQIGERVAPAMEGVGGAGGAGGDGPVVPDLERYTREAPFILTVKYYTDADCSGELIVEEPVRIDSIAELR